MKEKLIQNTLENYLNTFFIRNKEYLNELKFFPKDFEIVKIDWAWFAINNKKDKNTYFLLDEKWNSLYDVFSYREWGMVRKYLEMIWYYEINNWWTFELYNVLDLVKISSDPVKYELKDKTKKPIEKNSKKYFEIWDNAMFYTHKWYIKSIILNPKEKNDIWEFFHYEKFVKLEYFRLEEIIAFQKLGYLDEKRAKNLIKIMTENIDGKPSILENQINDFRLIMIQDAITRSNIRNYHRKWYINDLQRDRCINLLKIRDEKLKFGRKRVKDTIRDLKENFKDLIENMIN